MILDQLRKWTDGESSPEVLKLIQQLDSKKFAEREAASMRLIELAAYQEPLLRKEMGKNSSSEIQARIGHILRDFPQTKSMSCTMVSRLLATCVRLDTKNSRQILDVIASGPKDSHATQLAKNAIALTQAEPRKKAVNTIPFRD